MKFYGLWVKGFLLFLVIGILTGCQTPPQATSLDSAIAGGQVSNKGDTNGPGTMIHKGDEISVSFQDVLNPIPGITTTVKEDGTITLIFNQQFDVGGRTTGQAEKDIRDRYVPKYFVNMTPTVQIAERFFTVGGEVRSPGRQVYKGRTTVLNAIDFGGGFTDYAKKTKVLIIRADGKKVTVNCKKALQDPKLDIEIFPGDQVSVPHTII